MWEKFCKVLSLPSIAAFLRVLRVPSIVTLDPCEVALAGSLATVKLAYTVIQNKYTHFTPLHSTPLHYTALHCTTVHYTTLHYTTLHCTALHCTTLHYTTLHYITLHYITLHSTPLHYIHSFIHKSLLKIYPATDVRVYRSNLN